MGFCTKCGGELFEGDRFCRSCGAPIAEAPEPSYTYREVDEESYADRAAGATYFDKCPACGEPLEPGDKVCPACDYEISALIASNSVNTFINNLSAVEARAADGDVSYVAVVKEIDAAPIPHSAKSALAFLSVAEGRVSESIRDYGQGPEAKKAVLQAWATKSRHVYDFAKLSLSDEPEFEAIERTYKKIDAVSGAKGALQGVAAVNKSLLHGGCLGQCLWFFLVMMILGVICQVLNAVFSNGTLSLGTVIVIVVAVVLYRQKKSSK